MSNLFGRATQTALLSQKLKADHEQARQEMQRVAKLQRSLLPTELPKVSTLDLAVYSRTTAEAGGDYYNVLPLPRGRVGLLLADVCGHGVAAAMVVAVVHSLVTTYTGPAVPPGHLLAYVNDHLTRMSTRSAGTFVTAVYAVYDPDRATLSWANAGHPPPRLVRAGGRHAEPLTGERCVPLGIVDGTAYPEAEVNLAPGDQVLLHTDGVTDAKGTAAEAFGLDRLDAMLARGPAGSRAMIGGVLEALDVHRGRPAGGRLYPPGHDIRPIAEEGGRNLRRVAGGRTMSAATPEFVETPLASIPDRQVETVLIDRFRFEVERPADSYALLDDPVVRAAHERDEYMPYWADLWPAARMLAKAVAKEDWAAYPKAGGKLEALELGLRPRRAGADGPGPRPAGNVQRLRPDSRPVRGRQRPPEQVVRLPDAPARLAAPAGGPASAGDPRGGLDVRDAQHRPARETHPRRPLARRHLLADRPGPDAGAIIPGGPWIRRLAIRPPGDARRRARRVPHPGHTLPHPPPVAPANRFSFHPRGRRFGGLFSGV